MTHYLKIKPDQIKSQAKAGNNQDGFKMVAEGPDAIIFISLGDADGEAKKGTPIKLLAVEGVAATPANVGVGTYPISRPLILVTKELPTGLTRAFIDFALSARTKENVQKHGFIPYLD